VLRALIALGAGPRQSCSLLVIADDAAPCVTAQQENKQKVMRS